MFSIMTTFFCTGSICLAMRRSPGSLNERFDHILVDEYQDTNRLQASILHRMRSLNRNLTVVGDDAQSIYSFRAAAIGNILDFPAEFPGTTVIALETNYRSTQPILDATNRIIGLSPRRHAKELRSVKGEGPKPALITCEREEDQTDFVVEKVLEHNEQRFGSSTAGDPGANGVLVGSP